MISDAAHDPGGNPGFWWLAPMVAEPELNGTFQAGYAPRVTVVCLAHTGTSMDCDPETPLTAADGAPAEFTVGAGLSVEDDHFQVVLDTRAYDLRPTFEGDTTTYRIIAWTDPLAAVGGPFVLGVADFRVGTNGATARRVSVPGSILGLVNGQTVPVRFFINESAYAHAIQAGTAQEAGQEAFCQTNCSVTLVTTGTEASLEDDGGGELTAVQFGEVDGVRIVVIDEREEDGPNTNCAPDRPGEKRNCFRYEVSPAGEFPADFRFGVCPVGITFGAGIWQLVQVESDGSSAVHGDEDVSDFLPCAGADGSGLPGSLSFLRPVLNLLVGTAYAEDTKLWGGTARDFSDFFWEVPATMSASSATTDSAAPGSIQALSVLVQATHPTLHGDPATPLGGAEVVFTVTGGTGTLATPGGPSTTATVVTDGNGVATVELTVAAGSNTVAATSTDAAGGPVTFEVLGPAATSTTLETTAPLAASGGTTTLTATVTPAPTAGSTVQFFDADGPIGTAATDAAGVATLSHALGSALVAETFTASFGGDGALQPSVSAVAVQHKYTAFGDLASFTAALGTASVETQDFQAVALGSAGSTLIPGVLDLTSPFGNLEVTTCPVTDRCLFGFDGTTRAAGAGSYTLVLAAARNALAFDIVAQDPDAPPASVVVATAAGSVSLSEVNETGDESQPNFFGIVLTLPITTATLVEGPEVGGGGNEEIGMDNIRVASTLNAFIQSLTLASTTLTINGASVSYSANLVNPTGASLTGVGIQAWVEQGATRRAAGGSLVTCGGIGVLPAGTCTFSFTVRADDDGSAGTGLFTAGPAEAVFELSENGTVLHEFRTPVMLQ